MQNQPTIPVGKLRGETREIFNNKVQVLLAGTNTPHGQDYQEIYESGKINAIIQADGTSRVQNVYYTDTQRAVQRTVMDGYMEAKDSRLAAEFVTCGARNIIKAWEVYYSHITNNKLHPCAYPFCEFKKGIEKHLKTNATFEGNSTLSFIAYDEERNKILYGGIGNPDLWLLSGDGTAYKLPFVAGESGKTTESVDYSGNLRDAERITINEIDLNTNPNFCISGCALVTATDGYHVTYRDNSEEQDTADTLNSMFDYISNKPNYQRLQALASQRSSMTGDDAHIGVIVIKPFDNRVSLQRIETYTENGLEHYLPLNDFDYDREVAIINGDGAGYDFNNDQKKDEANRPRYLPTVPVGWNEPQASSDIYFQTIPVIHTETGVIRLDVWKTGKVTVTISPKASDRRLSESLLRTAIRIHNRTHKATITERDVMFEPSNGSLIISLSELPRPFVEQVVQLVLADIPNHYSLLYALDYFSSQIPNMIRGEDTNKRKIGYNGMLRIVNLLSIITDSKRTPEERNKHLTTMVDDILNRRAISSSEVSTDQKRRLACCCCLTKFLSPPKLKKTIYNGIRPVTTDEIRALLKQNISKSEPRKDLIVRLINLV